MPVSTNSIQVLSVAACIFVFLVGSAQLSLAAVSCSESPPVRVCAVSAALVLGRQNNVRSQVTLQVSVTLEVQNTSDYPLPAAFVRNHERWSFSPLNAEAVVPRFPVDPSGFSSCWENQCHDIVAQGSTELQPGATYRAQIRYEGPIDRSGLPLVQIASRASFSALLSIMERGRFKFVPLTTGEFAFGNGVSGVR